MKILLGLIPILATLFFVSNAYAVTCYESLSCPPHMPLDVLNIFDVEYGTGSSSAILAILIGSVTLCIYMRDKSLTMLTVLGIYDLTIFAGLLTQQYFDAQYQTAIVVVAIAGASSAVVMILKLVKE
jgi:hypothetical protein